MQLREDVPGSRIKDWQGYAPGFARNTPRGERIGPRVGHTLLSEARRPGARQGDTGGRPAATLAPVTMPHFANQVGMLEVAGGEIGVRDERVPVGAA